MNEKKNVQKKRFYSATSWTDDLWFMINENHSKNKWKVPPGLLFIIFHLYNVKLFAEKIEKCHENRFSRNRNPKLYCQHLRMKFAIKDEGLSCSRKLFMSSIYTLIRRSEAFFIYGGKLSRKIYTFHKKIKERRSFTFSKFWNGRKIRPKIQRFLFCFYYCKWRGLREALFR